MIGTTVSHYKILDKLGEGGMGIVYKAQDTKLDRIVAIKFLPQHLSASEENKTRFIQEAKATAALNHPNILGVFEIDEQDKRLFFVMEFVEGSTLKKHIANLKSGVPLVQALEWTAQIAQGLKAAHDKNIVHRDIKPENVMVSSGGKLKIMDFGIAKLKSSSGLTKTGTSLGTLSYMSPEQAQGDAADQRSDIWSLGVVLYEMLTSDLPFKSEHEAGLLYLIVNEDPPTPSLMDRKIPHQIDTLIQKLLAKDRSKRYQTMDEVLNALQETQRAILSASAAPQTKAIAVLPFGNISPDKESDYFSDGLTEELIINLSRLKDIRVVPRTTSMQYKGTTKEVKAIGRELATRYILAGSVRKFQDNLRIAVELVDIEADAQLWAETYKGKLEDVFDIQEQVSKQIVDALMVKLTPTEKVVLTKRSTENAEAFDYHLRARNALYRMTKNDINSALHLFQRAIELDGRYASAYAGLGEAYSWLYFQFDRKDSYLDRALEASLKALMYDPTLSEAYASLSLAHFGKKAYDEALDSGRKALELDPNNYIAFWILGRIYHAIDRDRDAVEMYKKCQELNGDFYGAFTDLVMTYEKLGEKQLHREQLLIAIPVLARHLSRYPDDARAHMINAIHLVLVDRVDEAKRAAAKALELNPNDSLMLYNGCCFYARLGEKRLSLDALKNAILAGHANYEWMKRDPDLDSIRNEPEYIEIMKGK
ncbi:MAG TPA: protein kinase [Bacteroidota bacterium]|jgi:serine/threonine protein kinase/Flp pilus assembly protein TadD|nr:protein kinase [Bacteroidota bacterium]